MKRTGGSRASFCVVQKAIDIMGGRQFVHSGNNAQCVADEGGALVELDERVLYATGNTYCQP